MKQRFAWTPHAQGIVPRIAEWAAAYRPLEIFALLDGSMFDLHALRELAQRGVTLHSAFVGTPLAGYEETGPMLYQLGDADQNAIQHLVWKARGIPALSFIAARCDAESLSECLAWLALVQTEDGQNQLCRFADTRILPSHLDCLAPGQMTALAASIGAWAWIARDGTLQERRFEAPAEVEDIEVEPLRLSARQFDRVMTAAEPDMLFQMLVEHSPELIPDGQPHEFHARLTKLIKTAKEHGLIDLPDLLAYAIVALMSHDDFDHHPAVQETWQRLTQGDGRFGEHVEQWPASVWQSLQQSTGQSRRVSPPLLAQDGSPEHE